MQEFGKPLIIIGLIITIAGIILATGVKIPYFGKLPGDIHIKKENFSFYFPLATCIVISAVMSLIFLIIGKK